jgi:hypothetical protein
MFLFSLQQSPVSQNMCVPKRNGAILLSPVLNLCQNADS